MISKKRRKIVFSRIELQGLISKSDPRMKALIALLYLTGGRISEVLGLPYKDISPLRTTDFRVEDFGDHTFLVVHMPVVKRRTNIVYKDIPIPLIDPLAFYIVDYLKNVKPNGILFDITRQGVWQKLKPLGINPHSLRHSRITELASYFSYGQLYKFAGWRLPGADEEYVHLGWRDYAPAIIQATKERAPKKIKAQAPSQESLSETAEAILRALKP